MRDGIQRNLYYKSFHWLPSAGNNPDFIFTPNAMNCRTNSLVSIPSYPGDYMAGREFDLGYTRFMMNRPVRPDVAYPASVFPHLANTNEWALTLIREDLRKGPGASQADDYFGGWTPELYDVYKLPLKAKVVELPYQKKSGMWELPGQIAWKRGGLYGIIFYAVDGANRKWEPRGVMSGGPLGLWSRELGYALASMRNSRINAVQDDRDITWSGVYGTLPNGKIAYSGKEHSDFKWIRRGSEFEITASLRPVKGTLSWTYTVQENESIYRLPGEKRIKRSAPGRRTVVYWAAFDGPGAADFLLSYGYPRGPLKSGKCPVHLFEEIQHSLDTLLPSELRRLVALYTELIGMMGEEQDPLSRKGLLFRDCLALIQTRYQDPSLNVNSLAEELKVHRTTLDRLFLRETGIPPNRYLLKIRLHHALSLLSRTKDSIAEIALQTGFSRPNYFDRVFRETMGIRPMEYRRRKMEGI